MYPLSKQETFTTNVDQLEEISLEAGSAYRALRKAIDSYGPLDD